MHDCPGSLSHQPVLRSTQLPQAQVRLKAQFGHGGWCGCMHACAYVCVGRGVSGHEEPELSRERSPAELNAFSVLGHHDPAGPIKTAQLPIPQP